MRAPAGPLACAMLLVTSVTLVLSEDHGGYHAEEYSEDPMDVDDYRSACPTDRLLRARGTCRVAAADVQCIKLRCCDTHEYIAGREDYRSACPTDRLLRARGTCRVATADVQCIRLRCCDTHEYIAECACPSDASCARYVTCRFASADVQCIRLRCCDTHDYIAGRCVPKSVDPCSLRLCEQACEVQADRLWCSCHKGFRFHQENYRRRHQPYCVDVDECAVNNGGCEQRCVNDIGGFHCECSPPQTLSPKDGKSCERAVPALPEPLPLIRATSRCYAPCDTVSWLSRQVKQLTDQLRATETMLKKVTDHPIFKQDSDRFAEGTFTYRVLDATAPLEGGYCRCERGPRGPPGASGMEGPKGDAGPRGPRGARGPKGSLDLMLLLLADIRHDIRNLEARVYKEGEQPERFNLQKAWRYQRKQERMEQESLTEQALEAYTAPPLIREGPVEISPNGQTGDLMHSETTTDWTLVKGETEPPELPQLTQDMSAMDAKLREFYILVNTTSPGDEPPDDDDDGDPDYSLY